MAHQRAQHAGGVGIAAGAGIVLGVGDHDRPRRCFRQLHGMAHALVGRIDPAVEIIFMADDQIGDRIGGGIGIALRAAIGEHARPAIDEIGGGKARCKGQRRDSVALERGELRVDALGGLVVGALPADRDQERQLSERFRKPLPGFEQQREMARRGAAGRGHVDMRIGAVGDERICVVHHRGRHVGVQVEADDERQIGSDQLAHAGENFTFAVVEMFGDHGAVQVEIDSIEPTGAGDAVHHHLDDALEGILGDMRRGARAAGNRRHHLPAIGLRLRDKTCKSGIHVAHRLQNGGTLRHPGPAAAMHEVGIGGLGRREGVGLVQERANGDTGHQGVSGAYVRSSSLGMAADVRLGRRASASDDAPQFCMTRTTSVIARCGLRQSIRHRCAINVHRAGRSPWPRH